MRYTFIALSIVGCAAAPVVAPTVTPEPAVAETPSPAQTPAPVAPPAIVPQTVHGDSILHAIGRAGLAHFVLEDGNGVISVNDAHTGVVRASMRPATRSGAIASYDDDLSVLVLNNAQSVFVWSLRDDHVRELASSRIEGGRQPTQVDPSGTRLLRELAQGDEHVLRVEDRASGTLIAERLVPGLLRALFSGDGRTVLAYVATTRGAPASTWLLEPTTLATRHDLGAESSSYLPIPKTDRALFFVENAYVLRSTTDGSVIGTVPHVRPAEPEAYVAGDGRCIGIRPADASSEVHLFETERFERVLSADVGPGHVVLKDGCAGFFVSGRDGRILERRTDGPEVPEVFATLPPELVRPYDSAHIVSPDADTVIAVSDTTRLRFERGRATPSFSIGLHATDRERSIWRFGFLASGGVYVAGRDFVDLFRDDGYATSRCERGMSVTTARNTTRAVVGARGGLCDVLTGRSLEVDGSIGPMPERFVARRNLRRGVSLVDLERFEIVGALPSTPLALPSPVSEDGALSAHVNERAGVVTVVETARGRTRARIRLRHDEDRFHLYPTALAATSATHVTVYAFDGTTRLERTHDASLHLPTRALPFAVFSGETSSDIVSLETGAVVATVEGRPLVPAQRTDITASLPIFERPSGRFYVRVREGRVEELPIGRGTVVGASEDGQRVAVCDGARLSVLGEAAEPTRYGECMSFDQVVVHDTRGMLLHKRGVRLELRTTSTVTQLVVLRRGEAPLWIAIRSDGAYACSDEALTAVLAREAGSVLSARMTSVDPARRTLHVLAPLASLGR